MLLYTSPVYVYKDCIQSVRTVYDLRSKRIATHYIYNAMHCNKAALTCVKSHPGTVGTAAWAKEFRHGGAGGVGTVNDPQSEVEINAMQCNAL